MTKLQIAALACCCLIWLSCYAVVWALSPEDACDAVMDFEDDANLDCEYGGPFELPQGITGNEDGHAVWVVITDNGNTYERMYWVTDGGSVAGADLPDLDPDENPGAELQQPISVAQAHDVAEDYAERVFSDYASCTWDWTTVEQSTDAVQYKIAQQTSNGAVTDRYIGLRVSLGSGEVIYWQARDYTLPAAASATPSLTAAQAQAAAEDEYPALENLTPTSNSLTYFSDVGLVYQIAYDFDPAQVTAGTPPIVWVDAQTGDIALADQYLLHRGDDSGIPKSLRSFRNPWTIPVALAIGIGAALYGLWLVVRSLTRRGRAR